MQRAARRHQEVVVKLGAALRFRRRHSQRCHIRQLARVLPQHMMRSRMRLQRNDPPGRAHPARAEPREIADVRAHIKDDHAGLDELLQKPARPDLMLPRQQLQAKPEWVLADRPEIAGALQPRQKREPQQAVHGAVGGPNPLDRIAVEPEAEIQCAHLVLSGSRNGCSLNERPNAVNPEPTRARPPPRRSADRLRSPPNLAGYC